MINIKTQEEIKLMKRAGQIVYKTHQYLKEYLKPGVTTNQLNKLAEEYILSQKAKPSFKGLGGYPKTICTSINEEIVHGVPSDYKLKENDVISIDIGACYQGYHGDSAYTYIIGKGTKEANYLVNHTEKALYEGLKIIREGIRLGDISHQIETYANKYKLSIVRGLVGHGIGKNLHEVPDVPNYGHKGMGPLLKAGMTLAIEPMLTLGSEQINLTSKWVITTQDKSLAAHFEHTVLVTKEGYEILTKG
ncbi:MAG: type I methionyl aminopeptidase [Bacilli bacterium]|jgi:methionyl aminopeptidase|nr:type I methionyl aminopeptidase [Bacilli bacterium]